MRIDHPITPRDLLPKIDRMFELSAGKIRSLETSWPADAGAPVFTVEGRYQSRGWTEWTEGFQFGSAILQFDATGDAEFLELGRARTVELNIEATGSQPLFHEHIYGPATQVVPPYVERVLANGWRD